MQAIHLRLLEKGEGNKDIARDITALTRRICLSEPYYRVGLHGPTEALIPYRSASLYS
jgi:hypothetical protein